MRPGPSLKKTLQCSALRIVLGVISTTPNIVVLHMSGEMKLRDRRRLVTCRYLLKCLTQENNMLFSRWRRVILVTLTCLHLLSIFYYSKYANLSGIMIHICKQNLPGSLGFDFPIRFFSHYI